MVSTSVYFAAAAELRNATSYAADLMGVTYGVAATMPVAAIEWRLIEASKVTDTAGASPDSDAPGDDETASPTPGITPLASGQYRTETYDPTIRYFPIPAPIDNLDELQIWEPLKPLTRYPRIVVLAPSDLEGSMGDQIGVDGGTTPPLVFVQLDGEPKGVGHWFRADDIDVLS